jgi:methyl-accepting chemotaxis protein
MTEMDAQVKESAGHAAAANQKAAEARSAIKDGGEKVQGLTDAMRQIGAASKRILGINKTVDEIAFQTNLLALNAAVEAARAGEAGAGFAVVADEVRSLARKASAAAQETSELITAAASDIQKGTNLADDAAAALETIGSSAGSLDKLVGLIAQASGQQSTGISAVSQAILELEKSALTQAHQTMAKDLVQIR